MLISVQSPNGSKRIECNTDDTTETLVKKIQNEFGIEDLFSFSIYKDRAQCTQIPILARKTINDYQIRHGDTIYLVYKKYDQTDHNCDITDNYSSDNNSQKFVLTNGNVSAEDEVDKQLYSQSGIVERLPDPKLCRHGLNAKCVHCVPIEPYNEEYLREHNIKHMSFHTYLRKLMGGIDKGKFAILENISCKIKAGCKEHSPWPNGICTKCQPNAITLNRQIYRHIDNVIFENASIVERFLNYWRTTGHQRIGFLYGYYSIHKDVPLGIKSNVVAIYEPPQESTRDFIKLLLPDKNTAAIDYVADGLGLKLIGWIFTDLIPEDVQKGTVKHLRNSNTHFLSAQECIMAGYLQNSHPNPCRYSPDGFFGSKFVTVCVTGDQSNHVHMEAYQVSNQCMALVRDNCLLPTKDAPELGFVRESSSEQYVPDVFYKEKDSYGNEVTRIARPLPIEYLLLDVPVSTPMEQKYTLNPLTHLKPFPVENRFIEGHIQDFNSLSSYLNQFTSEQFLEAMSDFHLLIYITTMDTLPLKKSMDPLLEAIKTKNRKLAKEWSRSEEWATVEQLIMANNNTASTSTAKFDSVRSNLNATAVRPVVWSCKYCTFENDANKIACDMCNLPKDS